MASLRTVIKIITGQVGTGHFKDVFFTKHEINLKLRSLNFLLKKITLFDFAVQ